MDRADSLAILIGISSYRDPSFTAVPAAAHSLRAMHQILVNERLCGWPYDQVVVIPDPVDCRRLSGNIRRMARQTAGDLLLYFVGHGTLGETGDLILALADTDEDTVEDSGLEYSRIRSALIGSPARIKAVILDCCYSGRAIDALAAESEHLANGADIQGAYTLTAADHVAGAGILIPQRFSRANLLTSCAAGSKVHRSFLHSRIYIRISDNDSPPEIRLVPISAAQILQLYIHLREMRCGKTMRRGLMPGHLSVNRLHYLMHLPRLRKPFERNMKPYNRCTGDWRPEIRIC